MLGFSVAVASPPFPEDAVVDEADVLDELELDPEAGPMVLLLLPPTLLEPVPPEELAVDPEPPPVELFEVIDRELLALPCPPDFVFAGVLPWDPAPPPEPEVLLPLWTPPLFVPELVCPDTEPLDPPPRTPVAEPVAPPTMPINASTSHRTVVLLALCSDPFSMMSSVTSPRSASTSSIDGFDDSGGTAGQ
jgi:hypothetical protein